MSLGATPLLPGESIIDLPPKLPFLLGSQGFLVALAGAQKKKNPLCTWLCGLSWNLLECCMVQRGHSKSIFIFAE